MRSTRGEESSELETFNPPIYNKERSKQMKINDDILVKKIKFSPSQNTLPGSFAAAIMNKRIRDYHPRRQYYLRDI